MLHWVQETKRLHKKVEGHFPGASETTLAKLKLLGTDCDHEAMTGQEAFARLMQVIQFLLGILQSVQI